MRGLRSKSFGSVAREMSLTLYCAPIPASILNFCALVENTSLPPGASSAMQRSMSARVIALHIEDVVHALAVRERWRIEKNQVVLAGARRPPS